MNLPTYEKDHYVLDNGEELNREYPDSYEIPEKDVRESLQAGSIAKLVFRMEASEGSDELSVERMWVRVTKTHPDFYEGVLDNEPNGSDCVVYGQIVYFQSCHIIDIHIE